MISMISRSRRFKKYFLTSSRLAQTCTNFILEPTRFRILRTPKTNNYIFGGCRDLNNRLTYITSSTHKSPITSNNNQRAQYRYKTSDLEKTSEYYSGRLPIYCNSIRKDENSRFICVADRDSSDTATIGIFIDSGSADELHHGSAHFIEHINFRSFNGKMPIGYDLNTEVEERGAELNAYTSREYTHYYLTCMNEDIEWGLKLLKDLVFDAKITSKDIAIEKSVIMKELEEVDLSVEEFLVDRLHELCLKNRTDFMNSTHKLGRTILGSPESIMTTNKSDLESYRSHILNSCRIIVHAIVGDEVSLNDLSNKVDEIFTPLNSGRCATKNHQSTTEPLEYKPICAELPNADTKGRSAGYDASLICGYPIHLSENEDESIIERVIYQLLANIVTDQLQKINTDDLDLFSRCTFYNYRKPDTGLLSIFLSASQPVQSLAPGVQSEDRNIHAYWSNKSEDVSKDHLSNLFINIMGQLHQYIGTMSDESFMDAKVRMVCEWRNCFFDPTLSRGLDQLGRLMMYGDGGDKYETVMKKLTKADLMNSWNRLIQEHHDVSILMINK